MSSCVFVVPNKVHSKYDQDWSNLTSFVQITPVEVSTPLDIRSRRNVRLSLL